MQKEKKRKKKTGVHFISAHLLSLPPYTNLTSFFFFLAACSDAVSPPW